MSKIYHFHSLYLFIEVWILVSVGTNPISLGWRIGWFTLYKKCLHFLNWNIYLYLFANFQCCIEMTLSMALNRIYPLFKFLIAMSRKRASPVAQTVKNLPVEWETWVDPCFGKIPWRRKWKPTPVFLPGEFREQRSLVGYSPWGHEVSDMNWAPTYAYVISIYILMIKEWLIWELQFLSTHVIQVSILYKEAYVLLTPSDLLEGTSTEYFINIIICI